MTSDTRFSDVRALDALLNQLPTPLFDPAPLRHYVELAKLNQEIATLIRIIEPYLKDASTYRQQVCQAIAQEDADALRRAAHTLKSSSRSLGAIELGKICEAMEQNAIAKRFAIASLQRRKLEKVFDESVRILTQLSQDLSQ
ncbi:MAG: Hpt domain-containing protein [Cyanobacteria bacterium P01_D01_bin.73]